MPAFPGFCLEKSDLVLFTPVSIATSDEPSEAGEREVAGLRMGLSKE